MSIAASTTLTSAQIRQQYIDFFVKRHGHVFAPSSPVAPLDDPTLLFTNAGMNQFKPIFLGQVDPASDMGKLARAVNSQKCIRAGGKHNDLDDVGKDLYHHTFFEMLGNWSFGDYFKKESIAWAWELFVDVWKLDPERLYATYFEGDKGQELEPDREAYELWCKHLPAERVLPGNLKDNFWEMGETGPCGPCSEIHYDGRSDAERSQTPGYALVNKDHADVIELWNLVFIQFNRAESGLSALPANHVDTGLGLERITRVLQGKDSNYDTDIFSPLFARIQEVTGAAAYGGELESARDVAYRVIADHIRTLVFAITDGADPSNEGRGYVLRRILRRAVRYGRQTLGAKGAFLCELAPTVVEQMGGAFPELQRNPQRVVDVIRDEEESFGRTLNRGIELFQDAAQQGEGAKRVSAEDAFKLHDTYGFPVDLTQIMAEERGMTVDVAGFERLMEEARQRARAGGGAGGDGAHAALTLPGEAVAQLQHMKVAATDDSLKFETLPARGTIRAIWNGSDFDENVHSAHVRPDARFGVVLDRTSFYAEMGGQVGDQGRINIVGEARSSVRDGKTGGEFQVEETRAYGGYVLHFGRMRKGEIRVGDRIEARVDRGRRAKIMANHTATHLLNLSLRETLGEGADQKGSLVADDRLRFDFSHGGAVTTEEAGRIERMVNEEIAGDKEVFAQPAPLEAARSVNGLRAVFGEAYPDPVRVVSIGAPVEELLADPGSERWRGLSIEFCGGTHLGRTGEAEAFALIEETAVAKGVRRMTAVTGAAAKEAIKAGEGLLARVRGAGKLEGAELEGEVAAIQTELEGATLSLTTRRSLQEEIAKVQQRIKAARKQSAAAGKDAAVDAARRIAERAEGSIIIARLPGAGADRGALLSAMDSIRKKRGDAAVMLIGVDEAEGKIAIVANVPEEFVKAGLKAGDWVRAASAACGGKGGGRPDSAQGGGTEVEKVSDAIEAAKKVASAFV